MAATMLFILTVAASWLHAAALQVHRLAVPLCRPARSCCVIMLDENIWTIEDDLFDIIGVSPDAAPGEIKRAFHQQARRLHPDYNPGEEAAREFRRLVAAFETLSDSEKRMDWERLRRGEALGARVSPQRQSQQADQHAWRSPTTAPPPENSPIYVQGGALRTWTFRSVSVMKIQVVLSIDDEPLDADIELWHGPDDTPCKIKLYTEDGQLRPFSAIVGTPRGPGTVAVRNNGNYEKNVAAKVFSDELDSPSDDCLASSASTQIIGGEFQTYPFHPSIDSVQVLLRTDGHALNAKIQLLHGPNDDNKETIEVYHEGGFDDLFFCFIETPGSDNAVRVYNTGVGGFPINAAVVPHAVNPNWKQQAILVDAEQLETLTEREEQLSAEAQTIANALRAELETRLRVADEARQAAPAVDATEVERLDGCVAALVAAVNTVAVQAKEEAEATTTQAMSDAYAADADAKLLRTELQDAAAAAEWLRVTLDGAAAAADVVTGKMGAQLQAARDWRTASRASASEGDARGAEGRRLRRLAEEARREADEKMVEFAAGTEVRREQVAALCAELQQVGSSIGSDSKARAAREEAFSLCAELEEVTTVTDAMRAVMDARLQVAAHAQKSVEAVLVARDAHERGAADAESLSTAAEAAELRDLLQEALDDVEAVYLEMKTCRRRMQRALEARQSVTRVEQERREQLQARVDSVMAQLQAIASSADAQAPPGIEPMSAT